MISTENEIIFDEIQQIEKNKPIISHDDPWWKSMLAGYVCGTLYTLTGHPFDTIKVRIQTQDTKYLFRHLYKGILPPLIATPSAWTFNFWAYGMILSLCNNNNYSSIMFSGLIANITWATCMCPIEIIKCYSQRYHVNTFKSIKQIYKTLGNNNLRTFLINGIYRGYISTLIRDVPSGAVFFSTMEFMRSNLPNYNESIFLMPFISGVCTNAVNWFVHMPGDVIKSKVQTDFGYYLYHNTNNSSNNGSIKLPNSSFLYNAKILYKNCGILGFFKGYPIMLLRGFFVAGVGIVGTEHLTRFVNKL